MKLGARRLDILVFVVLCAAALSLAETTWSQHKQQYRGVALGPDQPVVANVEVPHYGINADLRDQSDVALQRSVELLQEGGFGWVRQHFAWREIEPVRGGYQWERADRLVEAYRRARLSVVAVLDLPPPWARVDNNWPNRPPDDYADFGRFAASFAARFRGAVDHLQLWDEPNVFPNWGNRPIDPEDYVALLRASYKPIKAANPDATVLMAGLAPNDESGGRNMGDLQFLKAVYDAGGRAYFDIAAAKPYGLWFDPYDRSIEAGRPNFSRLVQWRELMVEFGDGAKPIWAVEFGWNALPDDWTGRPSSWGRVAEREQGDLAIAALMRAREEWPWLPVLLLEGYRPNLVPDDPRSGFSIVDAGGQPRQLYDAMRKFTKEHPGAPVGRQSANSPDLAVTGTAERVGGTVVANAGDGLRLNFYGTRLDLYVQRQENGLPAQVWVDGRPANRLLKVGGVAWLDSSSRRQMVERVTVADGLAEGEHELVLTVAARHELNRRSPVADGTFRLAGFAAVRGAKIGDAPWPVVAYLIVAALALIATGRRAARWHIWRVVARSVATMVAAAMGTISASALRAVERWSALPSETRDLLAFALTAACITALYAVPHTWVAASLTLLVAAVFAQPASAVFGLLAAAPLSTSPLSVGSAQVAPTELIALAAGLALITRGTRQALQRSGGTASASMSGVHAKGRGSWLDAAWSRLRLGFEGPMALLVVAALAATIFAGEQREAWRELRTVVIEPLVLYALLVRQARSTDALGRFFDALVLVGVGVALVGIFQYAFSVDAVTAEDVRRVRVFYGSPNNVGLLLGRVIPLALCIGLGDARRRWHLVALVPLVATLVLTFSIGAWLAVASALVFVAVMHGRRVAAVLGVALVSTAAAALALVKVERITSHLSLDQGTNLTRILLWRGSLDMLRDHPLLGVGPDNFYSQYRSAYRLPEAWREPNLSHPHNLILDFWLRTGFVGLVAASWLLARFFTLGLNVYYSTIKAPARAMVLGTLASMVASVAHGLVDNSFFLVDLALVLWFLCGALEVVRRDGYNTVDPS